MELSSDLQLHSPVVWELEVILEVSHLHLGAGSDFNGLGVEKLVIGTLISFRASNFLQLLTVL